MTDDRGQDPRMQELYGMYDDIIFKMALSELQERELDDIIGSEMSESEITEMYTLFSESEKGTYSVIDHQFNMMKLRRFVLYTLPRVGIIVAVAISLLTAGLVTAVATVPVVRTQVLQFIQRIEERYTELSVISDALISMDIPPEWEGEYCPFYMPAGYSAGSVSLSGDRIFYRNLDGTSINFHENDEKNSLRLDTEGAEMSTVSLKMGLGCLYEKGDYLTLVLSIGNKCIVLDGDAPRNELLRIADSIRKIH